MRGVVGRRYTPVDDPVTLLPAFAAPVFGRTAAISLGDAPKATPAYDKPGTGVAHTSFGRGIRVEIAKSHEEPNCRRILMIAGNFILHQSLQCVKMVVFMVSGDALNSLLSCTDWPSSSRGSFCI